MGPNARRGFLAALVALFPAAAASQTFRSNDPVLRQMWNEGMVQSQAAKLAQVLMDSIGPRLSGTAGYASAGEWLQKTYAQWNVTSRKEQYGTWRGWRQGAVHVDMIAPRVQTLDAKILAWSPGTGSRPIEGDVVVIPELADAAAATTWLASTRGKIVLASVAQPSCREPASFERLARPATVTALAAERSDAQAAMARRLRALGNNYLARIDSAGASAILTSNWSQGWGVNKIFGTDATRAVSIDVSCEDYGLLYRLATNRQGPRVRINADAQAQGTAPMFNVIAELKGRELPNEYVMLSAHLDSWHSATGATDNGTGTITMLEAMRILKATYPNPRRTILVGHWGGEEQGLIGSRAFSEDHPDVVQNLQALFNQDNGTWRIEYIQTQGLLGAGANLAKWVGSLPTEISEHIKVDIPGPQETGGSDHVSFMCHGAPGWRLQSHYPDYRQYTWHTNRDTYDKIVIDDLKNNATLAAMLMYLASEDPVKVPRDRSVLPPGANGQPREWLRCAPARRSYQ
jgi:carboxypeptidase Q